MIKMAQFCNTFNLEFCIIPHTSSALDGVSIRVERKTDKKIYRQILTNAELYGYRANLWLDFENFIYERIVEEFNLDRDSWSYLKQQWREQECML